MPAAPLPTIWRVPDDLRAFIEGVLLELDPSCWSGRRRMDQRKALDGIIYRARTGCQWNPLPLEFGHDRTGFLSGGRTSRERSGTGLFPVNRKGHEVAL